MSPEERAYFSAQWSSVRGEIKELRKALATRVESLQAQLRKERKRNSELVAVLDKHGIDAHKVGKRGRPRKEVHTDHIEGLPFVDLSHGRNR